MLDLAIPNNNVLPFYNYDAPYKVERTIDSFLSPNFINYVYYTNNKDDLISKLDKLSSISIKDLEITVDNQIASEIIGLGYSITNIEQSLFQDFDGDFKIFTVELKDEIEDYNKLLLIEKSIKEKLNLYSKGIILELIWVLKMVIIRNYVITI